jgi:hypothetical protein
LSNEERELVSGAVTGANVDFADRAQIRPELIRWLCTNPTAKSLVDRRGIRVTNAMITGPLDLRNVSVEFYLRLHRCQIDGDINLNDAQVRSIGFSGSSCARFLAWRARITGQLFLTCEGDHYFRASAVVLNDAVVTGNISLEGANIGPPGNREPALAADRATVSGILFAAGARIRGTTAAYDAEFGGIDACGAYFTADNAPRTGCAVEIVRTVLKGNAIFGVPDRPITRVNGTFALTTSHIGGMVSFADVQLSAAPQPTPAESGTGAEVVAAADDLLADDIWPTLLNLAWTSIGGNLELRSTLIEEGSIDLSHVDVKLNVLLTQHQN